MAGQSATTNRRNRFRLIQAVTKKRESDRQRHLAERVSSRDTRKEKTEALQFTFENRMDTQKSFKERRSYGRLLSINK